MEKDEETKTGNLKNTSFSKYPSHTVIPLNFYIGVTHSSIFVAVYSHPHTIQIVIFTDMELYPKFCVL